MNTTQEALAVITNALTDDSMPVYHALRTLHTLERKSSFNEARVKLLEAEVDAMDKGYAHCHRLYEASQRALGKVLTENRINAEGLEVALAERDALLEACEALDAAFMPDAQAFDTLAVWAARDLARKALKEAPTMNRNLCYKHHCQEFDKLPDARRHEASYWHTVDPTNCELCNPPPPTPEETLEVAWLEAEQKIAELRYAKPTLRAAIAAAEGEA